MAKVTYSEKLKDPRWQQMRLTILNRDGFKCQLCGDEKTTLHVHHFCYNRNYNPWDVNESDLITYCEHCHSVVEEMRKEAIIFKVKKYRLSDDTPLLHAYGFSNKCDSKVIIIGSYTNNKFLFTISIMENMIEEMAGFIKYPEKLFTNEVLPA